MPLHWISVLSWRNHSPPLTQPTIRALWQNWYIRHQWVCLKFFYSWLPRWLLRFWPWEFVVGKNLWVCRWSLAIPTIQTWIYVQFRNSVCFWRAGWNRCIMPFMLCCTKIERPKRLDSYFTVRTCRVFEWFLCFQSSQHDMDEAFQPCQGCLARSKVQFRIRLSRREHLCLWRRGSWRSFTSWDFSFLIHPARQHLI